MGKSEKQPLEVGKFVKWQLGLSGELNVAVVSVANRHSPATKLKAR
jgi:hypothetical protein